MRAKRVTRILDKVEPIWNVQFGNDVFFDALHGRVFDLVCHHAAEMTDYRSWDFDALDAAAKNTREIRRLLTSLAGHGRGRLIITGSVFEPYEGIGDPQARHGASQNSDITANNFESDSQAARA